MPDLLPDGGEWLFGLLTFLIGMLMPSPLQREVKDRANELKDKVKK